MQSIPYPNDSSNMQTHDTKPPNDQSLGLPDTVTKENLMTDINTSQLNCPSTDSNQL
jgi:hypothetical protein